MADDDKPDEVSVALQQIRGSKVGGIAKTAAEAALAVIPYAGGSIASVIASYRSGKQIEKVCDVLGQLHDRIKKTETKVEEVLTEDQVNEVLHESLTAVAVSSDQLKIDYLTTGLTRTFTDKDLSFDRKQLFLSSLRSMSGLELRVLRFIYGDADPFQTYPPLAPNPEASYSSSIYVNPTSQFMWQVAKITEDEGSTLLEEMQRRLDEEEPIVRGIASKLDQQGLTAVGNNLTGRLRKIFKQVPLAMSATTMSQPYLAPELPKATPIEASQTPFGRSFFSFFRRP